MHRRSLRRSGAVVAAAVCLFALVTVPAAGAADYIAPKVSIVPVNGTDLPATTTTAAVSATITPGGADVSIPTPYYYVLAVADLADSTTPAGVLWKEQITGSVPSLTISGEVSVAQGHEYAALVAACASKTIETGCGVVGALSYLTVGMPVTAAFTYPEVSGPSGYWCAAGSMESRYIEVKFTRPLHIGQTYSLVWTRPEALGGPYEIQS